jgi:hypothetical protein
LNNKHAFNPSKPFVITALVTLIIGSIIGSVWMMMMYGVILSAELANIIQLHKLLQFEGFITLIIMGIGYLIVPRFRNVSVPSTKLVYVSYGLILASIIFSIIVSISSTHQLVETIGFSLAGFCRILGVGIFCFMILLILRIPPKLLRLADYFIGLSTVLFACLAVSNALNYNGITNNIQLWLMFPIMMIFGIEYKTLPSFIGFIWPRKNLSILAAAVLTISLGFGLASSFILDNILINAMFRFSLLAGIICFSCALNVFAGFDNSNILRLSKGEKRARYEYTLVISKLSFALLLIGIFLSIVSLFFSEIFFLYDMWIHITAIGFIGLTVALYLPLMLPPILGRTVRFIHISKLPIWLIIISLGIRVVGDIFIHLVSISGQSSFQFLALPLSLSGWLILAAILSFMFMIHRSMNAPGQIYSEDGTMPL